MQGDLKALTDAGVVVVGISYDSVEILDKFAKKEKIEFALLSDPDHKTIVDYGLLNKEAKGKAEGDALVCGDDAAAKALALELAQALVTGRALDAGPLASARALEGMTAVIVNLNRGYGGHAGVQILGL